jgi:protein phosphatase 1 regulatory subunit 11
MAKGREEAIPKSERKRLRHLRLPDGIDGATFIEPIRYPWCSLLVRPSKRSNHDPSKSFDTTPTELTMTSTAEAAESNMDAPFEQNDQRSLSAFASSLIPLGLAATATTGSRTVTITQDEQQHQTERNEEEEILLLSLRARPSVRWDDSVVDNEGLGRKNSKRCCIFHKERNFGESSTDSSDYEYDSDKSGSSSASGGAGGNGDGDKKPRHKTRKNGKIARPKKKDQVPDSQRFHA